MADNILLNLASSVGQIVATEQINGVHVEKIKIVLGNSGIDNGDVSSTNPMPIAAISLPLPTGAATAANQQTNSLYFPFLQ